RSPPRSAATLCSVLALVLACSLSGCNSGSDRRGERVAERGPAPAYAEAAARFNEVATAYDHLWTPVALRVRYRDANSGKMTEDLLDGHFQAIAPDRVALRIDKLSETYAYLGCDAERYWWIDVKAGSAIVGTHARATPSALADFDIPVHPLDLIALLGIVPVDPTGYGATRWSTDGKSLGILTRARFGNRLLWVDPKTYEPTAVEITDENGRTSLRSTITRPERIPIDGDRNSKARIATQYDVAFEGSDFALGVRLQAPENRRERMRPAAFNMDTVLRTYRVKDIIDVDAPSP
ncbi:MAG: hypothetical protein KF705_16920, partial [Phycisphaeraceae bacterium]|nr:hypothetical protein [Phycisphaeraceae bacterium]